MKLAITADWHVRGKNLTDAKEQIGAMIRACHERGVEHVVHCGDVFDHANIYDGHVSTGAIAEVVCGAIASSKLQWLFVVGNHDVAGAGSVSALATLMGLPGVTVVEQPCAMYHWGLDFGVLPWMWDNSGETAEEAYLRVSAGRSRFVFGHASLCGGLYANGMPSQWNGKTWMLRPETIQQAGKRCWLGDYHRRQPYYVGALLQQNFGEAGNPMGFVVYDVDLDREDWVPLSAARPHEVFVMEREDSPLEIPPRTHAKVVTKGFRPSNSMRALYAAVEEIGSTVTWSPEIEKRERQVRAAEQPVNMSDKMGLFRLWCSQQTPEVENQTRLERRLAAVLGGAA